jgi:succinylglutamate desuccinylase
MVKILLNILTHGDELAGVTVADTIRALYPEIIGHGLDIQIANEYAFRSNKRYVDKDLNRVFPGNPVGCYEEIRANELKLILASYDLVIDIHSTESGSNDIVIVTKFDSKTKETLSALSPKYVLFMNIPPDCSLISCARVGLAFEMGSDKDESTVTKTIEGVEFLLSQSGLIGPKDSYGYATKYFEVFGQVDKPQGSHLESEIKNFVPILKGQMFARTTDGNPIVAEFDFYPVIFGSNNYETIFGFAAHPVSTHITMTPKSSDCRFVK